MKLTPELLAQASAGLNPVKERQLDLRGEPRQLSTLFLTHFYRSGYKIPTIENLGVTRVCAFDFVCLTLTP